MAFHPPNVVIGFGIFFTDSSTGQPAEASFALGGIDISINSNQIDLVFEVCLRFGPLPLIQDSDFDSGVAVVLISEPAGLATVETCGLVSCDLPPVDPPPVFCTLFDDCTKFFDCETCLSLTVI